MNINVKCPINHLGYGTVGRNILQALDSVGFCPTLFPIGKMNPQSENDKELLQKCVGRQPFFDYNAPSLQIWHQFVLAERVGNGPNIALSFFEVDNLKPNEVHHLKSLDLIWAASKWAEDVMVDCGLDEEKIFTQSMGVDSSIFYPKDNDNDKYVFLNIGKIEYRKGHDILAKLFEKAFHDVEDVQLQMMWHNPFIQQKEIDEWYRMYKSILGDKVSFISPVQTDAEVATIINSSDCGIFPTRAEGFGLPILQTMACNNPVITTNYSALTEFCTKDNSYLVDIDSKEDAYDGKWFHGNGKWAELRQSQEDQFIEHLRYCYKNRPVNTSGVETAKKLSWTNAVENFKNRLTSL